MWKMEKLDGAKSEHIVEVESVRLDDVISNNISPNNDIWIAKIDVQGYEPFVFQGLSESIQRRRIKFILFEYWPKGMDLQGNDNDNICESSVNILNRLVDAGYILFALHVTVHPHSYASPNTKQKGPEAFGKKLGDVVNERPLDDFMENCRWYYKLDETFPMEDYFMGFWSDIIAVAPNVSLEGPITTVGESIKEYL
mmetsp:Transcript_54850/g.66085  ORF Transcript_54850/g.66085 Transcript_54850/m.66085 type:complete len:197 (+) Transcript_54850:2-592(+)